MSVGDGRRGAGEPVDLLVAGAGPAGLALALQAHDHGARVRVVERRTEAPRPSRALVVHPRTLEVLRPLGVTDALLARGDVSPSVRLHLGSRVVPLRLEDLDLADTAFPHLLLVRQSEVETVLRRALAERGVEVEWGSEVVGLCRDGDPGGAVVGRSGANDEVRYRFLAGCDGATSTTRRLTGVAWRGGPYAHEVVLADVELAGDLEPGVAHAVAGRRGLLFVFAIGERATWRLLGTRPVSGPGPPHGQPGPEVPADELQALLDEAGLEAAVTRVAWSEVVRLQHRLASRWRTGDVFLVGDAAHAHSPAAAQGMNAGIQDATNLGWKLACAASARPRGLLSPGLLDSYEQERRPVARRVLALTHAVFWAEAGTDPLATFVRAVLAPLGAPVVPHVVRQRRVVAEALRVLSQFRVHYRRSPLSVEGTPRGQGGPKPGDRLPDEEVTVAGSRGRLHGLLARPGVHVLLQRDAAGVGEPGAGGGPVPLPVHVHRVSSWPGSGMLVVRPDGYVGLRSAVSDPAPLADWLALVTGRPGPPSRSPTTGPRPRPGGR